jgi:hypothetical protein
VKEKEVTEGIELTKAPCGLCPFESDKFVKHFIVATLVCQNEHKRMTDFKHLFLNDTCVKHTGKQESQICASIRGKGDWESVVKVRLAVIK